MDLVVTISPEHRALFETAVEEIRAEYEQRYGVRYNITFTYQAKETDTLAVDADCRPFSRRTAASSPAPPATVR